MRDRTKLAIGTAIWWLAAVPGAGVAMMAPMMFDAPGSLESPLTVAAALLIVSCPVLAALCPVLAWGAFALSWRRAALVLILAPILPVAGVAGVVGAMALVCGGSLVCHG